MEFQELRERIDEIDSELTRLFEERMDVVSSIAAYKKEHNLPIFDPQRERQKLSRLASAVRPDLEQYAQALYADIFELSRGYQSALLASESALRNEICTAIRDTDPLFPQSASVACQGVEGAYSQLACEKLFKRPQVLYFKSFESVFAAIESGLCRYGILPLENSTAGSVTKIYDLMLRHDFKIVRSLRLKVDHNLMAKPGVRLQDVREIFSHEQAISQCASYLEKLGPSVKITRCENTAMAAAAVAASQRDDVAAISSHSCLSLYGLSCLASDIQDRSNNYTRFICISKDLEIYPGADKTSIMMILPHKPGSLYHALARFNAMGLNLIKLESRPLPDRDFEFMFYFDLETSIYSKEFIQMMGDMHTICDEFKYLGSYSEVI